VKKSLDYYNNFDIKLIKDYVYGNKRIESAIINLGAFIPVDVANILDIGCGLGWSTFEFSKHFKKAKVLGVDLSPVLIERARDFFSNENLSYDVYDVTTSVPEIKFDAIVLIDVYEHIPKEERYKFHISLKNMLNDKGRLMLACPSKFHQSWLKENNPSGLQPIDEDVDFGTILDLAKDVNGEVLFFEYQKIWNNLDYFYSVIDVAPKYGAEYNHRSFCKIKLEDQKLRVLRVRDKLNFVIDIPKESKTRMLKIAKKIGRKFLNKLK
jgi:SAM-dependent methyltransferase